MTNMLDTGVNILVGIMVIVIIIIIILSAMSALFPSLTATITNITGTYSEASFLSIIPNIFWLIIGLLVIVLFLAIFGFLKLKGKRR